LDSTPKQKRSPNQERTAETRLSVDRPVDRPGRPAPTKSSSFQSVDRVVDRSLVVHTGRPGGRPALSTGRPGSRPGSILACCMRRSCSLWLLVSVLAQRPITLVLMMINSC